MLLIPLLEVFIPLFHYKSFFKYRYETLKVVTAFCNSAKVQFLFFKFNLKIIKPNF